MYSSGFCTAHWGWTTLKFHSIITTVWPYKQDDVVTSWNKANYLTMRFLTLKSAAGPDKTTCSAAGLLTSYHLGMITLQIRNVETVLFQCWASVEDGGPTLKQHCFSVMCLLGKVYPPPPHFTKGDIHPFNSRVPKSFVQRNWSPVQSHRIYKYLQAIKDLTRHLFFSAITFLGRWIGINPGRPGNVIRTNIRTNVLDVKMFIYLS